MSVDVRTNQLVDQYTALRLDIWQRMHSLIEQLEEIGYTNSQAWEMIRGMEADVIKPMHVEYLMAMARARGLVQPPEGDKL